MSVLTDTLDSRARTSPEKIAISQDKLTIRYADLNHAAQLRSDVYASAGIGAGQRTIVRVSNTIDDVVSLLAVARLDAIPLLVDRAVTDAELTRVHTVFKPQWVIGDTIDPVENSGENTTDEVSCFCLMTSGGYGQPKIVAFDWNTCTAIVNHWSQHFWNGDNETVLCTTPISHSYGFCVGLVQSLCSGSAVVLSRDRLTAHGIYNLVRQHNVSIIQSVPFYYKLLIRFPDENLRRVRLCISAGETLTDECKRDWSRHFEPRLCNHYGASEVGQISIEHDDVSRSVGFPYSGCAVQVRMALPEESEPEAVREAGGRIWIRAEGKPSRYLGQSLRNDPSRNNGWFDTGDIGFIDPEGRIIITGRAKTRINVGGRKVDRIEVEEAIAAFPGILDCAVTGRQSSWMGEELCAFIRAESLDHAALMGFLRSRLSDFKIPKAFVRVDEIPRTLSGKIRYTLLNLS